MGTSQSGLLNELEVGESLRKGEENKGGNGIYKIWSDIAPARLQDFQDVTIFTKLFHKDENDETKKFYENCIKNLKILRHPCIAKYYSSYVSQLEVRLIVERVRPLDFCLKIDEFSFEPEEILSGLQSIFEAVKFLHENAKLSHNNICPPSVFVRSDDHIWKLGSFEFSLSLEGSSHWCQSDFVRIVKESRFVPPEDQKVMSVKAPWHARDIFGLGKLVEYVLPYLEDKIRDVQLRDMVLCTERLCDADPTRRPRIVDIDYSGIFENSLSELSSKLRNIPYMTNEEKDQFFDFLLVRLQTVPPVLIARRLTKLLLSRYVFIETSAIHGFARRLLTPQLDDEHSVDNGGLLPVGLFKRYVVPELKKMFCVHEKCIRLNLLQLFDNYVDAFDRTTLQDLILPELLLGMKDVNENVVAASMRCLSRLVPLLGTETVTGLVHRKYFSEGRPRENPLPVVDMALLTSVKSVLEVESSQDETSTFENKARRQSLKLDNLSEKEKRRQAMEVRRQELESKRKSKSLNLAAKKIDRSADCDVASAPTDRNFDADNENTGKSVEEDSLEPNFARKLSDSSDWGDADWTDDVVGDADESRHRPTASTSVEKEPPRRWEFDDSVVNVRAFDDSSSTTVDSRKEFERHLASVNKEKPLGQEFDISAVKIRADPDDLSTKIDDIFGDMTPVVRRPLIGRPEVVTKFNVRQQDDDDDVDGWGDED